MFLYIYDLFIFHVYYILIYIILYICRIYYSYSLCYLLFVIISYLVFYNLYLCFIHDDIDYEKYYLILF